MRRRVHPYHFVLVVLLVYFGFCLYLDPSVWPGVVLSLGVVCIIIWIETERRLTIRNRRNRVIRQRQPLADHATFARADELLDRLLAPEQREEYKRTGQITATIYKFKPIVLRNGWSIQHGNRDYCVGADDTESELVIQDKLIAQLLMARTDPNQFFRLGNRLYYM